MESWHPLLVYTALFVISLLASSLIPLGSEWLLIALLLLGYNIIGVVTVATLGNTLGAITTYAVGRYGGHSLAQRFLSIRPNNMDRAQQLYLRFGIWTLLFSWLPIIGDPLCAVSGFFKTHLALFSTIVLTGKLARYAAVAWITLRVI